MHDLTNMNATKLKALGWTPEKLRDRLRGTRENMRLFRSAECRNKSACWTYRWLNARFYMNYKHDLFVLLRWIKSGEVPSEMQKGCARKL
jgi:hypothetical protein